MRTIEEREKRNGIVQTEGIVRSAGVLLAGVLDAQGQPSK